MRKHLFTLAILAVGGFAFSQNYLKNSSIKTKQLSTDGVVKFVAFTDKALINSVDAEYVLKEALNLNESNKLVFEKTETDVFGGTHSFYKQYYNGVEVAYQRYAVHSKNGLITSINGNFSEIDLPVNSNGIKSASEIYQLGLNQLGSQYQLPTEFQEIVPQGELVVLPKQISTVSTDRYAYSFPIISQELGTFEKVFFDAQTGEVLKKESLLKHNLRKQTALTKEQADHADYLLNKISHKKAISLFNFDIGNAETRYSGTREIETTEATDGGFNLVDGTRFLETKNFSGEYLFLALTLLGGDVDAARNMANPYLDSDNNWTEEEYAATKDDGALEAHWGFSQTYDFFKTEYDRDGFDNANGEVTSFIHTTFFFSPLNAAWLTLSDVVPEATGGFMLIGDGDYVPSTNSGSYDIFAGLDVISHEFAHGVDGAAGNLVYERESGALDEGFADIWGATIEAKMAPEKEQWTMGEDFVMVDPAGFRSFDNPKLYNQPDTYKGINWVDATPEGCVTPGQDNDNCGVHTNSGVLNYWYYLTTEGGSGTNDHDYDYTVSGIGIKKAADLVYSTQINYVQSQSEFVDVMGFTIQEAGIMFGEDSTEVNSVKAAWCAVGVAEPDSEICTTLSVQDLTGAQLSIYPNPVVDVLNIKTSKSTQNLSYKINNVSGQLLQQGVVSNDKINVNILPKGVYVLTLKGSDVNQTIKFIKK